MRELLKEAVLTSTALRVGAADQVTIWYVTESTGLMCS